MNWRIYRPKQSGRSLLHVGRPVLPSGPTRALLPQHLARLRTGGERLPLLLGDARRGLVSELPE